MKKHFLVVAGLGALLLLGCSGDRTLSEQEYLEQAKEFLDHGKYNDAIIQLKNAIGVNPNSAEGRYLLGELYVNVGLGAAAEKELQRAEELGVADDAIVLLMGDALLQQGKADEVIKNYLAKETDSPQIRLSNTILVAEAYFQKKDYEAARDWFGKATALSSDNDRAVLGLARLAIVDRDYGHAQALIDSVIDGAGKQSQRAWLTLGDLKRAQNSSEEVIAAYRQVAELSESKRDYSYYVAMRGMVTEYLQQNNPDKAEAELNILRKSFYKEQFPDDVELTQIRATLAYEQKNYEAAAELAGKVLRVDENHPGATLLMGAINAIQGQNEQAEVHLLKFLSQSPSNIMARKLLAYVQMNRGHAKSAVDTLTPVVKGTNPDSEMLALIAGASLRAGDPRKSSEYYQQALSEKSDSSDLRIGLAQSYVGMQEFGKAIAELNRVKSEQSSFFAAELAIAETRIKEKNYQAALESLQSLEKSDKNNPLPVSMQGSVFSMMGDEAKAKKEFQRALKIKPGYAPAARSLALFELRAGKSAAARQLYEAALKDSPKELSVLYDYAQLEMSTAQYKHAESLLKQAQELDRDKSKGAVLLARLNLRQNNPSGALSELRAVGEMKNSEMLAEMGNAQMMLKEYLNAKESYRKLVEGGEGSAADYYLLYTACLALGDGNEAKSALNRSLQKDGKYIPSLVASVNMALSENAVPVARERLKKLEALAPGSDGVVLLKADLAMREKRFSGALALYSELYRRKPTADLAQRVAQAHWANGDKRSALSVLTVAVNKQPKNAELHYSLAVAYQELGDKTRAIDSYKTAVRLNSQDWVALNNLAWLLKDSDPAKAREYAEKALELAPNSEAVKDTLAQLKR